MLLPCLPCLSLCHPSLGPTFSLHLKSAHRLRRLRILLTSAEGTRSHQKNHLFLFFNSTIHHVIIKQCHLDHWVSANAFSLAPTQRSSPASDTRPPLPFKSSLTSPKGPGDTVMTIKIDITSPTDAKNAAQALQTHHQISKLDLVHRQCLGPELDRCPTRCCRSCASSGTCIRLVDRYILYFKRF